MITTSNTSTLFTTRAWAYCLIIALALLLLVWRLGVYPAPWFDEGFTTHLVRVLIEHGIYGTYSAVQGYVPFDSGVSSGPPLVYPMALSFKLLGMGMAQARIISVLFALLTLVSIYEICAYLYGRSAALFTTLALLAAPAVRDIGFVLISRQVLGEPAALALLALGLWFLFRNWASQHWLLATWAGVCFGLALLAKSQWAVTVLPTLGLVLFARWVKDHKRFSACATPLVIMMAIFVAWRFITSLGAGGSAEVLASNAKVTSVLIETQLLLPRVGHQQ